MATEHPQVWLECPEQNLLTEVDEQMVCLLDGLGVLGIETIFSCQGQQARKDPMRSQLRHMAYIMMKKNSASLAWIQHLQNDYAIFKPHRRSNFVIEYSWRGVVEHPNRIVIRFPNEEIEALERFVWLEVAERKNVLV